MIYGDEDPPYDLWGRKSMSPTVGVVEPDRARRGSPTWPSHTSLSGAYGGGSPTVPDPPRSGSNQGRQRAGWHPYPLCHGGKQGAQVGHASPSSRIGHQKNPAPLLPSHADEYFDKIRRFNVNYYTLGSCYSLSTHIRHRLVQIGRIDGPTE